MKILALPKAEVFIFPYDLTIKSKSFIYFIGDPYPSKEMGEFIKSLKSECSIRRDIFSPLLELSADEFVILDEEIKRFQMISGGVPFPKRDMLVDGYQFKGCTMKSAKETESGSYRCEFSFDSIVDLTEF